MNRIIRALSTSCLLFAAAIVAQATSPSLKWRAVPPNSETGAVIYPVAHAIKGSSNLANIRIWYSWDNVNWTLFLVNLSPNNNNAYDPNGDFLGSNLYLSQSGTLYLKATVTDTASASATSYASTSVASGNGVPSLMAATIATYNYGVAWMNDSAAGKQKCWWTAMYPGGGDCIVYAEASGGPPGSTTPTIVVNANSNNVRLLSSPTVIKDSFSYGGNSYNYVMYFISNTDGTNSPSTVHDSIERCFSTNGTTWTTPTTVFTSSCTNSIYKPWGLSFPSIIKISSGNYVIFYGDIDNSGNQVFYYRTSSDGMSWGSATVVTNSGLTNWGVGGLGTGQSAAYGVESGTPYYFMSYSEAPSNTAVHFYKIPVSQITSGTWTLVKSHTSTGTMHWKSNTGMLRNEIGHVYGDTTAAFATSTYFDENGTTSYDNILESQLYYLQ